MRQNDREKELQELSQAIVDALTKNEDVMALLNDLKEREVIDSSTLLGLALKISDLLEISGIAFTQEDAIHEIETPEASSGKGEVTQDEPETQHMIEVNDDEVESASIDGKELSKNEIAFQEWLSNDFDEKEWLKKTRLIW